MEHKLEYLSKDDLKNLILKEKQFNYELNNELQKEKERSTFWQQAAFFSWVLMIVMGITCLMKF